MPAGTEARSPVPVQKFARLSAGGSRIRTLGPGATKPEIALSSGQTAGTMAGARPLIRSTNSEANRQARPLVINARR